MHRPAPFTVPPGYVGIEIAAPAVGILATPGNPWTPVAAWKAGSPAPVMHCAAAKRLPKPAKTGDTLEDENAAVDANMARECVAYIAANMGNGMWLWNKIQDRHKPKANAGILQYLEKFAGGCNTLQQAVEKCPEFFIAAIADISNRVLTKEKSLNSRKQNITILAALAFVIRGTQWTETTSWEGNLQCRMFASSFILECSAKYGNVLAGFVEGVHLSDANGIVWSKVGGSTQTQEHVFKTLRLPPLPPESNAAGHAPYPHRGGGGRGPNSPPCVRASFKGCTLQA